MAVNPTNLFDSNGMSISLGHRIGVGGEGAVYEVVGNNDHVAKIYHKPLNTQKQEKLIGMAHECDDTLKKISAWPTSALHQGKKGYVCGFIMPRVTGFEPIHKLYSPAHRKQFFQKADWAFLVNSARNVSAVFEAMHARSHVVADVNYGNVVVAANSFVRLIDCDSFQVTVAGRPHLCEVGVAHFTPPELHGVKSFHSTIRTENHDNFGLALLCFHLLFMGRHPFSGVYSGKEDMPIERAIREFRFAFGRNAISKGMKTPPNSLNMSIVTPAVAELFEQAFSEEGVRTRRPNAREWVQAFDNLKGRIRTCQTEPVHKFIDSFEYCPWCFMEQKTGVVFFVRIMVAAGGTSFDLGQVWDRIISAKSPGSAPSIDLNSFKATPTPLPTDLKRVERNRILKKIFAVMIVIGVFIAQPSTAIVYVIVIVAALSLFFSKVDYGPEKSKRTAVRKLAESRWAEEERRWNREAGDEVFNHKFFELRKLREQYQSIPVAYENEKQKLHSMVKEHQLHKFLDNFFIEGQSIKGIGPSRKAALASFGIETAADITYQKVIKINGFGESLTSELIAWRKKLEGRFVFNPSKGIDQADIDALNQKYNNLRRQIEGSLLAGYETLKKANSDALVRRQVLRKEIETAAQAYVQATADAALLGAK
jgi:DNA-binding helix-hairpin-helix protein with protein kinase domain